eukprot:9834510-Karenia_brevis.AAC.1
MSGLGLAMCKAMQRFDEMILGHLDAVCKFMHHGWTWDLYRATCLTKDQSESWKQWDETLVNWRWQCIESCVLKVVDWQLRLRST